MAARSLSLVWGGKGVCPHSQRRCANRFATMRIGTTLDEKVALLCLPGGDGQAMRACLERSALHEWLRQGGRCVAICAGAYLLSA